MKNLNISLILLFPMLFFYSHSGSAQCETNGFFLDVVSYSEFYLAKYKNIDPEKAKFSFSANEQKAISKSSTSSNSYKYCPSGSKNCYSIIGDPGGGCGQEICILYDLRGLTILNYRMNEIDKISKSIEFYDTAGKRMKMPIYNLTDNLLAYLFINNPTDLSDGKSNNNQIKTIIFKYKGHEVKINDKLLQQFLFEIK